VGSIKGKTLMNMMFSKIKTLLKTFKSINKTKAWKIKSFSFSYRKIKVKQAIKNIQNQCSKI
jgi:hypothetical protein